MDNSQNMNYDDENGIPPYDIPFGDEGQNNNNDTQEVKTEDLLAMGAQMSPDEVPEQQEKEEVFENKEGT